MSEDVEEKTQQWTDEISSENSLMSLHLQETWHYRDLLLMFVRRDFVATYKQTILGPIWFFLQPILTTITYVVIFGQFAGWSTDGLPMILFYMIGITFWNYFSDCINKTSTVFRDNSSILGKVYFPRLIMPLSIIVSNLVKLGIQFLLFLIFFFYYLYHGAIHPNIYILLTPILILIMAGLGLAIGMIITSLTTKYRDLVFLITFGIQLFMYATPVIYPLSSIPEKYRFIIEANPMTSVLETFRFAYMGSGSFSWNWLFYSFCFMFISLLIGTVLFNRVEKSFTDTV
ncbi:MAG: ABC transporter permease [Bacteroidota bacterium]